MTEKTETKTSPQWVILFTSASGTFNEWEFASETFEQATAQATRDRRHLNYGRNGFLIVPFVLAPDEQGKSNKPSRRRMMIYLAVSFLIAASAGFLSEPLCFMQFGLSMMFLVMARNEAKA